MNEQLVSPHDERVLSDEQLSAVLGVAINTLRTMRARGEAPPIVKLSQRRHGTRLSVAMAWLRDREQAA